MNWHENGITALPLQLVSSSRIGDFQKMHWKKKRGGGTTGQAEDERDTAVSLLLGPRGQFYQSYMKLVNGWEK